MNRLYIDMEWARNQREKTIVPINIDWDNVLKVMDGQLTNTRTEFNENNVFMTPSGRIRRI